MIKISQSGNFDKSEKFLDGLSKMNKRHILDYYARLGLDLIRAATPVDSGETRNSWYFAIERKGDDWSIIWNNSHIEQGYPIAILLQYGHGTGTGGYVQGRDYLNPVLDDVFQRMADEIWRKVKDA